MAENTPINPDAFPGKVLSTPETFQKAWSPEAREAAAEARRGKGGDSSEPSSSSDGNLSPDKYTKDGVPNVAGEKGVFPPRSEEFIQEAAKLSWEAVMRGDSVQAGPDAESYHLASEEDVEQSGEDGGFSVDDPIVDDWNDTGDKFPLRGPQDMVEYARSNARYFEKPADMAKNHG